MEANQLMHVDFGGTSVEVYHKTGEVLLSSLWRAGNQLRMAEGKGYANQSLFLKSADTKKFIAECEAQNGGRPVIRREGGKGSSSKTYISLHLAVYAAEYLSTKFHYQVIDEFITNRILQWRDDSGNAYNALSSVLYSHFQEDVEMDFSTEDPVRATIIDVSIRIKNAVQPDGGDWNYATAGQLRFRTDILSQLVTLLNMDAIPTLSDVPAYIPKIVKALRKQAPSLPPAST